MAFPVAPGIVGTFVDSVGNIINYDKFAVSKVGSVPIRPTAVIGFVLTKAQPSGADEPEEIEEA